MSSSTEPKKMLAQKHLTPAVLRALSGKTTETGFGIADAVFSGFQNPDSGVGAYAGDAQSYDVLGLFFDPLIKDYHKLPEGFTGHVTNFDVSKIPTEQLDPTGQYIKSTRIRVGRNLAGYPLAPMISMTQRLEVMQKVTEVLQSLTGDLAGSFYPLEGMDESVRAKLVEDHFLFKQGDRFLEAVGANNDWPSGRGIFHTADKKFLVWVNEEDQLRIISMQNGGDVRAVFDRLARAVAAIEAKLPFAKHPKYGAVTSCPTNLGTAMRASVHIKVPKLAAAGLLEPLALQFGLSVRGTDGEHSASKGGVYDLSNKRRLGLSEVDAALAMYNGVKTMIEVEKTLPAQQMV